jgi:type I restriction enzyme R subunit
VYLKIYDRHEIAAGQSRYQIVQQPKFPTSGLINDRRGDLMLLINGMPVIHIELKKSGIPVSQAANQIEKYSREGIFTGLFALIQVFVAMSPEETVYFANPGIDGKFNPDFYFHWADFNNEPVNDWKDIASYFLSIPMAHQIIGFYTVPDDDGVLKVMRSYQYYAANAISDKVAKTKWDEKDHLYGGFIWHTTGSGKTMTSFKSAQLIANSKDADKVIFLMDRIELGTQSLEEYKGFAEENDAIQATENTDVLKTKLKSADPANTLIVTSIQKMSNIKEDGGMNAADLNTMQGKRMVFIVDECHRSTFGDMLITIKNTFPAAIFFGFTGTPIHAENEKHGNTTATVFGNELHRYSIADGIRDKNVLGFDPYMIPTYKEKDLREAVALDEANAPDAATAIADTAKSQIYYRFMDSSKVPMAGYYDAVNNYVKGIEDYLPKTQYNRDEHREMVVQDILDNWLQYSHCGKFHAIFATSSIPDAIRYYRLIKSRSAACLPAGSEPKITALFDPNIDNGEGETTAFKSSGLEEIITDYNARYGQKFDFSSHAKFKKDIAARLAHKAPYRFEHEPEMQVDLLIVVDQMLTGFDSKWINTLYLDKILQYENIIQAFSRTNRLFGADKPFGVVRYYRKPRTMTRYIDEAVKLYSGDKPVGLFVQRLPENLTKLNELFGEIKAIFAEAGFPDFEKNPAEKESCGMFAKLFKALNEYLEAAEIQGFKWDKSEYEFKDDSLPVGQAGGEKQTITVGFDETIYLILAGRYKELFSGGDGGEEITDVPYEIDGHLTEIDTGKIDANYMNSRFTKYLKTLQTGEQVEQALNDLHKTFATLTQEEQKYANIFLHDIQQGDVTPVEDKTLRDYITEYQTRAKDDQIHKMADLFGLNEKSLREMMNLRLTEANINEYGHYDKLKNSADKAKAKAFLEAPSGITLSPPKVAIELDKLLRKFLLTGGFDVA